MLKVKDLQYIVGKKTVTALLLQVQVVISNKQAKKETK